MIVDTFTFNGEMDLLEIHLNVLKDYVDEFIIVEAPTTFSFHKKPLYFQHFLEGVKCGRYMVHASLLDKIKYHVIDENYTDEEIALAENSPNTVGAAHWKHEFLQKESIKKSLTHLKDDDIVYVGDVDEIWKSPVDFETAHFNFTEPKKLKLEVYTYWLNNKSSEQFWGTIACHYRDIRKECLNHLRTNLPKTENYYGWHFTSMHHQLRQKLTDSYTKETYANDTVMNNLEHNVRENKDFLGRNFTYTTDESDWPPWLKEHRQRYKHMIK